MKTVVIIIFACFSLQAQVTSYLNIPYAQIPDVDENLLSLDVYIPDVEGKKPVAIYVHGGGWVIGDKSNIHEKGRMLTDMGYIFVSINYRLSPLPYELENDERIKYPDHPTDVAAAISFVFDRMDNYGGDKDNVFLFGHSTGAHLVATMITDQRFLAKHNMVPDQIKCACIIDTGGFDLESWIINEANDQDLFINAFTDDVGVWRDASPILNISESEKLPSTLLIYQDNLPRILSNQAFKDRLEDKTDTEVSTLSSAYNHSELNQLLGDTTSVGSREYTSEVQEWLTECMGKISTETGSISKGKPLYPNPAESWMNVEQPGNYKIISISGDFVLGITTTITNKRIDISPLASGTYILVSDHGWKSKFQKL